MAVGCGWWHRFWLDIMASEATLGMLREDDSSGVGCTWPAIRFLDMGRRRAVHLLAERESNL